LHLGESADNYGLAAGNGFILRCRPYGDRRTTVDRRTLRSIPASESGFAVDRPFLCTYPASEGHATVGRLILSVESDGRRATDCQRLSLSVGSYGRCWKRIIGEARMMLSVGSERVRVDEPLDVYVAINRDRAVDRQVIEYGDVVGVNNGIRTPR
jgi:hypothetical protein